MSMEWNGGPKIKHLDGDRFAHTGTGRNVSKYDAAAAIFDSKGAASLSFHFTATKKMLVTLKAR